MLIWEKHISLHELDPILTGICSIYVHIWHLQMGSSVFHVWHASECLKVGHIFMSDAWWSSLLVSFYCERGIVVGWDRTGSGSEQDREREMSSAEGPWWWSTWWTCRAHGIWVLTGRTSSRSSSILSRHLQWGLDKEVKEENPFAPWY